VSETPPVRAETILLVEDALRVRAVVREILEMNGYHVLEARHGAEAVDISERHRGPIQLMVTDVVMPQMSGRELAQRAASGPIRVLFISGYIPQCHRPARRGWMQERRFSQALPPDALVAKVREVLDGPLPNRRLTPR
jgi:CheY-like chemotaxis protein